MELEPVPVKEGFRPHVKCKGCSRVFVPHEGCENKRDTGLHVCENVPEHLA